MAHYFCVIKKNINNTQMFQQIYIHFWVSMYSTYLTLSNYVIKQLIPYVTTWFCKSG